MNPPTITTDQMMSIMKELADLRIQRDILMERLQETDKELKRVSSALEVFQNQEVTE